MSPYSSLSPLDASKQNGEVKKCGGGNRRSRSHFHFVCSNFHTDDFFSSFDVLDTEGLPSTQLESVFLYYLNKQNFMSYLAVSIPLSCISAQSQQKFRIIQDLVYLELSVFLQFSAT
jgi:hypothetical protein